MRFWKPPRTLAGDWRDWRWQQQHQLYNQSGAEAYFPNLTGTALSEFGEVGGCAQWGMTPHLLSMVAVDRKGNPDPLDPVWLQVKPLRQAVAASAGWEAPGELANPVLHQKYPDRAILRVSNQCFSYCNYCYLPHRTLNPKTKHEFACTPRAWQAALRRLREKPAIRDVLLSGGEPLMLPDPAIASMLADLRRIPSLRAIRLNTRALTFNPFRITPGLAKAFKTHKLTVLEIQTNHPREITPEFDQALARLEAGGHRPLIVNRAPLLAGVNDSYEVLEELCLKLYERRIHFYYLFHCAPGSPGRAARGTSIRQGVRILSRLRRRIPGPAFPRYTLFHPGGKQDIPLEASGTPEFRYEQDRRGRPIVRFRNWKNRWVTYPDIPE